MPRKRELTWQAGRDGRRGRWRKKYRGKAYYVGLASAKSDQAAYEAALTAWHELKAKLDAEDSAKPREYQADYEAAITEWEGVLRWSAEHGDQRQATEARAKLAELRDRLGHDPLPPLGHYDRFSGRFSVPDDILAAIGDAADRGRCEPWDRRDFQGLDLSRSDPASVAIQPGAIEIDREVWRDRLAGQQAAQPPVDRTVGGAVEAYLAKEQARTVSGHLSAARFTSKRVNVLDFRDWLGAGTELTAVTGQAMAGYHGDLLRRIGESALARDTAHGRLTDVKSFVRSLWETGVLAELPRNLLPGSKSLTIGKVLATPDSFTVEEVQRCLTAAKGPMRLYLLLMLNCGMYQTDIANLRRDEVDLVAGTITRKRSKTRSHASVPTVTYRLWPEVLALLQRYGQTEGDLMLRNRGGGPLVLRQIQADGRAMVVDNIHSGWHRLKPKVGLSRPMKTFRKTSSTLIGGHDRFRGLEGLFLGHSPRTMSERHYTAAPVQLLAEATDWLREHYGVTGIDDTIEPRPDHRRHNESGAMTP